MVLQLVVPRSAFPAPRSQASSRGFEPLISTVTGWRALQAAPRGRIKMRNSECGVRNENPVRRCRLVFHSAFRTSHSAFELAQVGFEPIASLCLRQRGLPVAYQAGFVARNLERGARNEER